LSFSQKHFKQKQYFYKNIAIDLNYITGKLQQLLLNNQRSNKIIQAKNKKKLLLNNKYNLLFSQDVFGSEAAFYEKSLSINNKQNVFVGKSISYREHLETILYNQFLTNVSLLTCKASTSFQSALFLAQEIVYCLEHKMSFREIKINLSRSLEIKKVKGVRISCSGRLGGRSKKAQRAKTESLKLGQTSLHVFSNKIDFKSTHALTPYGVVGVKVWICFY
jgi:small subunit ribosomal protein S3